MGEMVKTHVNEVKVLGIYDVDFDATRLSTGTYIYRLQAVEVVLTRKMNFIK